MRKRKRLPKRRFPKRKSNMQWYEYLLIAAAAAFVIGVIVWQIVRKKQGKSGCDCGGACSRCSGCSACREKEKRQMQDKK